MCAKVDVGAILIHTYKEIDLAHDQRDQIGRFIGLWATF